MKTCAVMQPYLFPYLGYYQLVQASDVFVFYDDVNYIKGGYINRNNILSNGQVQRFTVPINQASSFKKINELSFSHNVRKQLASIEQSYGKAPYFHDVYPIVKAVLNSENRNVAHICRKSVEAVFSYLGIEKETYLSSQLEYNREQSAAERLISISELLDCRNYINSPGGKILYCKEFFSERNIKLSFIEMEDVEYFQSGPTKEFVPYLSIIDIMMHCDKSLTKKLLNKFSLV